MRAINRRRLVARHAFGEILCAAGFRAPHRAEEARWGSRVTIGASVLRRRAIDESGVATHPQHALGWRCGVPAARSVRGGVR
jgi:hypothetical protein